MDKSPKKSKSKSKPAPKPAATSLISQPAVHDSSLDSALSAFSRDGNLFALLSLAVDKHRLRVHDTATGISKAEYIVESSTVTSLSWGYVSLDSDAPPQKKKRKKRASTGADDLSAGVEVVLLGLNDGTILLFSPAHAQVLSTLSKPNSSSSVLSIAVAEDKSSLWVSNSDGAIRLWSIPKAEIIGTWKTDDRIPFSSIQPRAHNSDEDPEILVASHTIRLLSLSESSDPSSPSSADVLASFTGHASPVQILRWDSSQTPPSRFVSVAEGDRVLCVWQVPEEDDDEGKLIASVPLEASPRTVSYASESTSQQQTLLTLDKAGKILIFPIPKELVAPASSKQTQHSVPTLTPRTAVSISSKRATPSARLIDATFVPGEPGKIRVARLAGGIKPVFDILEYLDAAGDHIASLKLDDVTAELLRTSQEEGLLPNRRYTEGTSVAVRTGGELGQDEEMDDLANQNVEGELDVDLAELSLGQRLNAISGQDAAKKDGLSSSDDEEGDEAGAGPSSNASKKRKKQAAREITAVPASSLTRTLIQALHSSDSRLLETCLAHSDASLIRNTVRRLPPQLAVPLINACVERLGRGSRAGNMKGRGGGASAQRGAGLVEWVRAVLVVHSGHLMSMPDLVSRLSKLHSTLTSRLALQESLTSLSGRLDMVLTQIELRSSALPSSISANATKGKAVDSKVSHYVEGESEEEDEEMDEDEDDEDVEIERDDDEGSVEDVELGGSGDEDSDEEEEESDEGDEDFDEDDDEEGGPTLNGFIDDEAEEEYSDEEDEEDSE